MEEHKGKANRLAEDAISLQSDTSSSAVSFCTNLSPIAINKLPDFGCTT